VPLERLGGHYFRGVFFRRERGRGVGSWKPCPAEGDGDGASVPAAVRCHHGRPRGRAVVPAHRPARADAKAQVEPVLKLDFDRPPATVGEAVGKVRQCKGVRGTALDLRAGDSFA